MATGQMAGHVFENREYLMIDIQYKFVNAQHERAYHDAKALLASEDARQKHEAERLTAEWAHWPEDLQREKTVWLCKHFHACREPYVKVLADLIALASPVLTIVADEQEASSK